MYKTVIGIVAVLALVIGGLVALTTSLAANAGDPSETPLALTVAAEEEEAAAEAGDVRSLDDRLAAIAQQVPGFGGLFLDEAGNVNVYLKGVANEAAIEATEAAIEEVLGADLASKGNTKTLVAQYDFLELRGWHDRAMPEVLSLPEVVLTDIDESKNRVTVGVENQKAGAEVKKQLAKLGIPLAAVNIEITEPVKLDTSLRTRHRPLRGGLQIAFVKPSGTFLCTLGTVATRVGVNGFITNSHCSITQGGVQNTVYHQHAVSGILNRVGLEIRDPLYAGGAGCPAGRVCRQVLPVERQRVRTGPSPVWSPGGNRQGHDSSA